MVLLLTIALAPVLIKSPPKWTDIPSEEVRSMIDRAVREEVSKVHTLREDGERWTIEITKVLQKNRSQSEILKSVGKSGSRTTIQILLSRAGTEQKLNGESGGSYFGTTDRWEMNGSPNDKAHMIRVVAKQRAEAIGKAVWNALSQSPSPYATHLEQKVLQRRIWNGP